MGLGLIAISASVAALFGAFGVMGAGIGACTGVILPASGHFVLFAVVAFYAALRIITQKSAVVSGHPHSEDWLYIAAYDPQRRWLILAEAVTSRRPVDAKRSHELDARFGEFGLGADFLWCPR